MVTSKRTAGQGRARAQFQRRGESAMTSPKPALVKSDPWPEFPSILLAVRSVMAFAWVPAVVLGARYMATRYLWERRWLAQVHGCVAGDTLPRRVARQHERT